MGGKMVSYQELVNEISQELFNDENVLALILYGSVSRHEESENSDIDLLAIVNEMHLQKRHEIRNGITVEFVEMHLIFLQNFIAKYEVPMLFTLANGVVLFDKNSGLDKLIVEVKKILENGPPANKKWENERYKIKKRSDLTEIYKDLLDIDDEINFNYIVSLLITSAIPMLLENNNLWGQTRKKMMNHLKHQCSDSYKNIEILLSSEYSLPEKRDAAERLTEYALKPHGGILKGDAVIFRVTNL